MWKYAWFQVICLPQSVAHIQKKKTTNNFLRKLYHVDDDYG